MAIGCGRFSEAEWAEYVFDPDGARPLARHLAECPLCREEARALRRTEAALRTAGPSDPAVRGAFSRAVVAEYKRRRTTGTPVGAKRRSRAYGAARGWPAVAAAAALGLLLVIGHGAGWWGRPEQEVVPFVSLSFGSVADESAPAAPLMYSDAAAGATAPSGADGTARTASDGVTAQSAGVAPPVRTATATPVLAADGVAHVALTVTQTRGDQ